MRNFLFFIKSFIIVVSISTVFSSCFISSRSDMDVFNKDEYANSVNVKTIKVPLLLTKALIKKYLKYEEKMPKEILDISKSIKKVMVTSAHTNNEDLSRDFRSAISAYKGDEWLSLHRNKQSVFLKVEQDNNDIINRLMVAVSDPEDDQLIYVNIECQLTKDQLSKLINFVMKGDVSKN